ncbi:MAG TPA: hypothetical protein VGD48_38045 [Kutzneria sp.]
MAKERRRRAYLPAGIVILAVLGGGQYYLSNIFAPADTGSGSGGTGGVPGADVPLSGPLTPELAVQAVYKAVAVDDPTRACSSVLKGAAGAAFAKDLGGASCEQAITQLSAKVTDKNTYKDQSIPLGAVHPATPTSTATVNSCAIGVEGGPDLGMFTLENHGNGWYIAGHQPDPTPCPAAESR